MRYEFFDMLINNIRLIHSLACKFRTKKKKKCGLIITLQNIHLIKKCGEVYHIKFLLRLHSIHIIE